MSIDSIFRLGAEIQKLCSLADRWYNYSELRSSMQSAMS